MSYPRFGHFVDFLREQSRVRNNSSFFYESNSGNQAQGRDSHTSRFDKSLHNRNVHVRKTETSTNDNSSKPKNKCPLHLTDHTLNKCRAFRAKPIEKRKRFLKEKKLF